MVRVHIDGKLFAEAERVLPERWNGWVVPVFSDEEMGRIVEECVRLGWCVDEVECSEEFVGLALGEAGESVVSEGWCWLEV